jgi:hypothetical protein
MSRPGDGHGAPRQEYLLGVRAVNSFRFKENRVMSTPFLDEEFTFTNPDGSTIRVRGTGNQF